VKVNVKVQKQNKQEPMLSVQGLHAFSAYTKSLEFFDFVASDLQNLSGKYELTKIVAQQLARADSISANFEEGYGRESKRDYSHFLIIAGGSAQETMGRYGRLKHWIDPKMIETRVSLCGEIIAILTASIRKLRSSS
jgi:four helix bundle protein